MKTKHFTKTGLFILFLFAILARTYIYLKNQSLWLDEAMLAINFLTLPYKGLIKGLEYMQASPAGFNLINKFLLECFKTDNIYLRDLELRFIPYLSSIFSLPIFLILLKQIFKEEKKVLFGFSLLAINPLAILYAGQCKQYSTEMLITILLLIVFNTIQNEVKWYYFFIIPLSIWFSYSAFFIIFAGFIALLILKKYKDFCFLLIPFLFSFVIYYLISLKSVFITNYIGMDDFWSRSFAFMDFNHPTRLFVRFGELFIRIKPLAIISGVVAFYSLIRFAINRNNSIVLKILVVVPILMTIAASFIHEYPIYARLILFLLPLFIISISDLQGKLSLALKAIIIAISCFALTNYTIHAKEMSYSYARDIVPYVVRNIKSGDTIITDTKPEYDLYFRDVKLKNTVIEYKAQCIKKNIDICRDYVDSLPSGSYYYLSGSYYVKDFIDNTKYEIKDLNIKHNKKMTKAIYFKKT